MKKTNIIICAILVLTCLMAAFVACTPDGTLKPYVTITGVWPENEFTKDIIKPKHYKMRSYTIYKESCPPQFRIDISEMSKEDAAAYIQEYKDAPEWEVTDESDDGFFSYTVYRKDKDIKVSINYSRQEEVKSFTMNVYLNASMTCETKKTNKWVENDFTAGIPKMDKGKIYSYTTFEKATVPQFRMDFREVVTTDADAYVEKYKALNWTVTDKSDTVYKNFVIKNPDAEQYVYISYPVKADESSSDGRFCIVVYKN